MSQLNLQEIFFKNCFLKTLMSFTHTSSNLQYQSKTIMTNQIPILLSEYTWIVILPSCLLLLKVRRTNSYELRTYTTDFLFHSLYFFPFLSFLNELLSALELPDSLLAGPETSWSFQLEMFWSFQILKLRLQAPCSNQLNFKVRIGREKSLHIEH